MVPRNFERTLHSSRSGAPALQRGPSYFGMVLHLLAVGAAGLLTPPRPGRRACRHAEVRMGMFDGLAAAFANDETLSKPTAATKKTLRTITWRDPKGKTVSSQAIPGQKLKDIARQDGIGPIKYPLAG